MKLGFLMAGRVVGDGGPDALDVHLDRVMDELVKLGVEDPSLNATLASGLVELSVVVEAGSFPEAMKVGLDLARTAIHAAGGGTPDWPSDPRDAPWGITLEETSVRKALVDA